MTGLIVVAAAVAVLGMTLLAVALIHLLKPTR